MRRSHRVPLSPQEPQPGRGRRPFNHTGALSPRAQRFVQPFGEDPARTAAVPLPGALLSGCRHAASFRAISRLTWGTPKRRRLPAREAQPQAAPSAPRAARPLPRPPRDHLSGPQRSPPPAAAIPPTRPPRHLRPYRPGHGGGWKARGLVSGGTIPHSPSGEGEPPPAAGEG